MEKIVLVFDHDILGQEAAMKLSRLRQCWETVARFYILFRAQAGETGSSEGLFKSLFINVLLGTIKDTLAELKLPAAFICRSSIPDLFSGSLFL